MVFCPAVSIFEKQCLLSIAVLISVWLLSFLVTLQTRPHPVLALLLSSKLIFSLAPPACCRFPPAHQAV